MKRMNMSSNTNFLSHINDNLSKLFTEMLYPPGNSITGWFKKNESLITDMPNSENAHRVCLWPVDMKTVKEESGTFNETLPDGTLAVYRYPVKISVEVKLYAPKSNLNNRLNLIEKINAYFFDNKSIVAIVPPDFKKKSETIYKKLAQHKAELSLKSQQEHENGGLVFTFEYRGLYHTGTPLRSEKRVMERHLDMSEIKN
jgi:hypothetical protein